MGQDDGVLFLFQFLDLFKEIQGRIGFNGQEAVLVQIGGGGMGRRGHDLVLDATDQKPIGFRSAGAKIGNPCEVPGEIKDKSVF